MRRSTSMSSRREGVSGRLKPAISLMTAPLHYMLPICYHHVKSIPLPAFNPTHPGSPSLTRRRPAPTPHPRHPRPRVLAATPPARHNHARHPTGALGRHQNSPRTRTSAPHRFVTSNTHPDPAPTPIPLTPRVRKVSWFRSYLESATSRGSVHTSSAGALGSVPDRRRGCSRT